MHASTADPRVVPAKVRMPTPRMDVVSRPRLLDRLDDDRVRTVVVSAPAGWGKSVLVLDWLRRSGRPVAWYSVGLLDDDPGRFLAHLGAAVASLGGPGSDDAARILARLSRSGGLDSDTVLLPALGACDERAVLVLDDVHHVAHPSLTGLLDRLVNDLVSGPRLVLLARVDPPVRLGRRRLSGELLEIRERDLRFTAAETAELFGRLLPFELPAALVTRLERRTEGWAAGLRLAAAAVELSDDPAAAVDAFTGSHELMVDYLLEEVLGRRDQALQSFLMETSILPRFTAGACAAVTGDPDAARHLEAVEEENLFLVSLDDRREWFRYHHLFAELLEYRLRRLHPDRPEELHRRASEWFEARGEVHEALAQAGRMEDPDRLVELLDRHGYGILARSEFGAFARWLEQVPEPLSRRRPMFLVAVTWFRAQSERAPDLPGLLATLENAVADPPAGYDGARLEEARLHLDALRAFALRITDRLEEAVEVGRDVLARLPEDSSVRGVVEFNQGAVHLRLAEMERAREHLERGYELSLRGDIPYLVLASLGHLGYVAAQTEGVHAARRRLESAVTFAEDEGLDGVPAFGIVLYQLAAVHWVADELEEALPHLERAEALTRGERETDIHANVLVQRARIEAALGRTEAADEALTRAEALAHAHQVKAFATTFDVERARLAEAAEGRLRTPATAPPSMEPAGRWSSPREAEVVLQLRHSLLLGRRDEVVELSGRLREESSARGRGIPLCQALVARAAVTEDALERRETLVEGLERAARCGYVRPLLELGPPARALLEASLGGALPSGVRAFVRDVLLPRLPSDEGDRPGRPVVRAAAGETELTERELETLAHLASGRSNRAIARELFVSVNTVKTHLKRIYAKLEVSNRTEAVERARRLGLPLSPPE